MFNIAIPILIVLNILNFETNSNFNIQNNLILLSIDKTSIFFFIILNIFIVKLRYKYIHILIQTPLLYLILKKSNHRIDTVITNNEAIFGLTNSISLIHPILIVWLISILILFLINHNFFFFKKNRILIRKFGGIIILALVTGSYWSSQEVLWGGW